MFTVLLGKPNRLFHQNRSSDSTLISVLLDAVLTVSLIFIFYCSRHTECILGDPGADKGGEGSLNGRKIYMERRKVKRRSLLFFVPHFSARLDFPPSPLSAPGSPRMYRVTTTDISPGD